MKSYHDHYTKKHNSRQAGFTLLEIMVVLVLIGLTAASVIPSLKTGDNPKAVEKTARRFSALVQIAHETALTTGHNLGIKITRDGYDFMVWKKGKWQSISDDRLLKSVTVDDNITLRLHPGESVWQKALELDSDSDQSSFSEQDNEKKNQPDLFIWSSGELTPVTIDFSSRRKSSNHFTVVLDESGQITLKDDRGEVRSGAALLSIKNSKCP